MFGSNHPEFSGKEGAFEMRANLPRIISSILTNKRFVSGSHLNFKNHTFWNWKKVYKYHLPESPRDFRLQLLVLNEIFDFWNFP